MNYKDLLLKIHSDPQFINFKKEVLLENIPTTPSFNPDDPNDEKWKYISGMREGYLLCLTKLGVDYGTGE